MASKTSQLVGQAPCPQCNKISNVFMDPRGNQRHYGVCKEHGILGRDMAHSDDIKKVMTPGENSLGTYGELLKSEQDTEVLPANQNADGVTEWEPEPEQKTDENNADTDSEEVSEMPIVKGVIAVGLLGALAWGAKMYLNSGKS